MWRLILIYVCTGVVAPLLITWVSIGGGCDPKTFLFVLPSYLGMVFLGMARNVEEEDESKGHSEPLIWLLACVDILFGLLQFGALLLAGPSVYLLGSSTSLLYLSALSKITFGRELSVGAWWSLVLVAIGLTFAANFNFAGLLAPAVLFHRPSSEEIPPDYSNAVGLLLASVAAFLHSLVTILLEFLLVKKSIPPPVVASRVGLFGTVIYGLWSLIYTLPNFVEKVRGPAGDKSLGLFAAVFVLLILNSALHASTMMDAISKLGATSVAVIKVFLGLCVFFAGHILFCSDDEREECFTVNKAISALLTSAGILLYAREEASRESNQYSEIKDEETKESELGSVNKAF